MFERISCGSYQRVNFLDQVYRVRRNTHQQQRSARLWNSSRMYDIHSWYLGHTIVEYQISRLFNVVHALIMLGTSLQYLGKANHISKQYRVPGNNKKQLCQYETIPKNTNQGIKWTLCLFDIWHVICLKIPRSLNQPAATKITPPVGAWTLKIPAQHVG